MATWHQLRRRVRLDDPHCWTLVIDPPHRLRFCLRYSKISDAKRGRKAYLNRDIGDGYRLTAADMYILKPCGNIDWTVRKK